MTHSHMTHIHMTHIDMGGMPYSNTKHDVNIDVPVHVWAA